MPDDKINFNMLLTDLGDWSAPSHMKSAAMFVRDTLYVAKAITEDVLTKPTAADIIRVYEILETHRGSLVAEELAAKAALDAGLASARRGEIQVWEGFEKFVDDKGDGDE